MQQKMRFMDNLSKIDKAWTAFYESIKRLALTNNEADCHKQVEVPSVAIGGESESLENIKRNRSLGPLALLVAGASLRALSSSWRYDWIAWQPGDRVLFGDGKEEEKLQELRVGKFMKWKDLSCAIFLKSRRFEDIKYDTERWLIVGKPWENIGEI